MTIHVVVIGSGPAGLAAASAAADCGASVTLIGAEPPGGRAGWHSLLPSKVLLTLADSLGMADRFAGLGLVNVGGIPDMGVLAKRIRLLSQIHSDSQMADLTRRGVSMLNGEATFVGQHHLQVSPKEGAPTVLKADAIIVATGSVPIFPPNLKPDGQRIIAPRFINRLDHLPKSIIVVGGGITGTEFAYGFNRLGTAVHWVVDEFGVLPPFNRDVTEVLIHTLASRGVIRYEGIAAESAVVDKQGVIITLRDGQSLRAEMAFIAIGRRPDVLSLNLEKAGLYEDFRQGIPVNGFGQSPVPSIYAAGDASGPPMTANKALAQGWIAGRHAAGATVKPYRSETMIEAVYSDPQVAQVGMAWDEAKTGGHSIREMRVPYEGSLKALLLNETTGLVKVWADAGEGTLLGAAAVGAHAADVLAPVALGLGLKARLDDLAALFAAYPSLNELAFTAARVC